jgi:N utilization substance protein B
MSIPQKKLREAVFYALFSKDFYSDLEWEEIVPIIMEQLEMSKKNVKDAVFRATLIQEKKELIDEILKKQVLSYELERVCFVERNILRLATYEILFDNEIPEVVAIAEGIRLCKKFSTPESAGFINGVLDGIYKSHSHLEPLTHGT